MAGAATARSHRLPAGVPERGDRVRRPERCEREGAQAARGRAPLRSAARAGSAAAHGVPGARPQPDPGACVMAETPIALPPQLTPPPLIEGRQDDGTLKKSLNAYVWQPPQRGWLALFLIGLAGTGVLFSAIAITVARGIGMWGNNIPVGWAFGIINFVWWIGIGHAGTLISAILLLFQQKWRTSINRFPT